MDAAERSAAELEAAARADAERIRAEARADLERAAGSWRPRWGSAPPTAARELESLPPRLRRARPPESRPAPRRAARPPPPAERRRRRRRARKGGEAPRLIALNMMLDGSSREEVARYLDENFDLEDPGELLDEVWSQRRRLRTRRALRGERAFWRDTNACSHRGGRSPL